jgi:glycosyltransferase involved in cell wall biosynthesis
MHILMTANYAPPYGGGIQVVIAALTRRLIARGARVTLLAADTGIPSGESEWEGARRIGIPASNVLERRSIPLPLFDPLTLVRTLERVLPTVDVVHAHGMLYPNSVWAAVRGRALGRRVILTEHVGAVPYRAALVRLAQSGAIAALGRGCVRACHAVVVLNARVEAEMRPLVRRGTPIVQIANGVDGALFRPPFDRTGLRARLGLHRPTLLFAGRNAEKKGVPLVLAAAHRLPGVEVVLCGQDTEAIAALPGIAPNVRVVGQVDQTALADWYGAADALVLPSEGEGFPLVLAEALACGTPVIVTDDSTNRAWLDESVARFIPRDAGAIAQAVEALVGDGDRLAVMRSAARPFALARFDWDAAVGAYQALYQGTVIS